MRKITAIKNVPQEVFQIALGNPVPKYYQLYKKLKTVMVLEGVSSGDKFWSENQIAELFSVDRVTVRKAISLFKKEGSLIPRQGKGTFIGILPDESLSDELENKVYLIIPSLSSYYERLVSTIENELSLLGYSLQIAITNFDKKKEEKYLDAIKNKSGGGLLLAPSASEERLKHFYPKAIKEIKMPVMLLIRGVPDMNVDYVAYDYFQGGEILAKHLLDLKHEHFIFIGVPQLNTSLLMRLNGVRSALKEFDLQLPDENIFSANPTPGEMLKIQKRLKNPDSPVTAIIISMDCYAPPVYDLLNLFDLKVPDDVALASFDDRLLTLSMEVPLTSVCPPREETGILAVRKLVEKIDGKREKIQVSLPCTLSIRASSDKNAGARSEYVNSIEFEEAH